MCPISALKLPAVWKKLAHNTSASHAIALFAFVVFALLAATGLVADDQTLEAKLKLEQPDALAASARQEGDARRGAIVFHRSMMTCAACHTVDGSSNSRGPDLTTIDKETTDVEIVESILEPSKTIASNFAPLTVATSDGRILTGLQVSETDELLVLRDAANSDKLITIKKQEIENRLATKTSIMPRGQVNLLTDRRQFVDLVRYLIELRDGGTDRALALQPPRPTGGELAPEEPLPWKPVVQRGEVSVEGSRVVRGLALGFVDGTVLYDADQLSAAAVWFDGFVKSSSQNYFGLYWHHSGSPAEKFVVTAKTLQFQLEPEGPWHFPEATADGDPGFGSRFDGYQIGNSTIRLRYHVRVQQYRIDVVEDVRVIRRPDWQGFVRQFQFLGMPARGRVSIDLPTGNEECLFDRHGEKIAEVLEANEIAGSPLLAFQNNDLQYALRVASDGKATMSRDADPGPSPWQLVSAPLAEDKPSTLRIDTWTYRGSGEPAASQLAVLESSPPELEDRFDTPEKSSANTFAATESLTKKESPRSLRPAVVFGKNVEEFPAIKARFLRFVVLRTNDGAEPCIDELEVYGAVPNKNLAREGKASASSALRGYSIHQISHLNDGIVGNEKSWISEERGGGWARIEFPESVEVSQVVWSKDRTGKTSGRLPVAYQIEVSQDGKSWTRVCDGSNRAPFGLSNAPIRRDATPGFTMESIPTPFAGCRPSDIVFSDDGMMYATAMTQGQVWRATVPPVGKPDQVRWQRHAAGLHHPIGLAIVDGRLYVSHKPEITELIDHDGDGKVDQYRTVASGWGLSPGWHEYCFGLAVDPQKNLWFALNTGRFWTHPGTEMVAPGRWRGSIMRVTHQTEKLEAVANGCRVPNGITQGPDGGIFFTDNQGDWIQACKLAHVVPGRFYGHPETQKDMLDKGEYPSGLSAVWLPYDKSRDAHSRSTSGPVFDATQGKFGPFAGQLFVGDVGYGANEGIMRIALEKVDGEYQGACFRFVDGQPLGCERMRFGPDNQLYMASLTSGLTRMAFDGKTPLAVHSIQIRPQAKGFVLHLTKSLKQGTKIDPAQFSIKQFHYLYTGDYGSPKANEKAVSVEAAELSPDGKSITLSFPVETYPIGMVYEFNVGSLTSASGEKLVQPQAWYTVHRIPQ